MYVLQRNIESERQLLVACQDRETKGETKVCEVGKVGPYTTQIGPIQYRSYHTAGVPGVLADGLRGLAGRSRGYPRVSSVSDTIGDSIPASVRHTRPNL